MQAAAGGVAYIDDLTRAYATTTERFCAGERPLEIFQYAERGPDERGVDTWVDIWISIFKKFTFRSVIAKFAPMVMRPDGVIYIFPLDVDSSIAPHLLHYLYPSFIPLDGGPGLREHDGFRLKAPKADVASLDPQGVSAMALIPGAPVTREWGYRTRPGEAWVAPAIDAGTPEDPGMTPGPTKPGCGCSSPSMVWLGALALLLFRQRKR